MEWMRPNKLKLNPANIKILSGGLDMAPGDGVSPILSGVVLLLEDQICNLGMFLDPALLLESRVSAFGKLAFYHLRPSLETGDLGP